MNYSNVLEVNLDAIIIAWSVSYDEGIDRDYTKYEIYGYIYNFV